MSIFTEIDQALIQGKDAFAQLISEKQQRETNFLEQFHMTSAGKLQTVLSYLISQHSKKTNYLSEIQWLLEQDIDINVGQPLHLVLQLKKVDLVDCFLVEKYLKGTDETAPLNFDLRDLEGKTLLYRFIENNQIKRIPLKEYRINVNELSQDGSRALQAIHLATSMDDHDTIHQLVEAGAQLDATCDSSLRESPLLMAARLQKINAMRELLERYRARFPHEDLNNKKNFLCAKNANEHDALGLLCIHLHDQKLPNKTIRGIAMLLCHGVPAPSDPLLHSLLTENRHQLFLEVQKYTKNKPELAAEFLRKCHNKSDPLHDIMYAKNSWTQSALHLFGQIDELAFDLEALCDSKATPSLEEVLVQAFSQDEILFAEFVKRYRENWKSVTFFNPYSEMRHRLARGEITCWQEVVSYANEKIHEDSRTKKIVDEMLKTKTPVHDNLDQSENNMQMVH